MPMTLIRERKPIANTSDAITTAGHQLRLEGLQTSAYALELFERRERNGLTDEEVRAKLKAYHSKKS